MIAMQAVLEVRVPADGFTLWPVAGVEPYAFLPLGGGLASAEVGAAVMSVADCNADAGEGVAPDEPLGSFLHGLLTAEVPVALGGLRVVDTVTGVTFRPGCCEGLEDWRAWFDVVDGGGTAGFGHDPWPLAERLGDTVRLTVDCEQDGSPVIELPVGELRCLLAGVERELGDFLRVVRTWAARYAPGQAAGLGAALAQALDMPERR
ncbi:hypothetical protein GCM10010357_31680 [Streptomyces luteireticuli]|uniref:SUKH-4 immunity protein of toxin-antitoxin system n=2 Tax=Streptomyces luteireticuli TaxID=173858 RepID=A0ABN0YSJ0_9ACTN